MIITDRFVFIHQPKCGGTFVTAALKRIHAGSAARRSLGPLIDTAGQGTKHAGCRAIPAAHRAKPILAVLRNPYDRYVSQYFFRWWLDHPQEFGLDPASVRRRPEPTFAQFVALLNARRRAPFNPAIRLHGFLGWQAAQFVHLYFRDPGRVCAQLDERYLAAGCYRRDMFPVRFLRIERLAQELHAFLRQVGYPEQAVGFVGRLGRVQPPEGTSRRERDWRGRYSPALKRFVRRRERLLFAIFPEHDV